MIPLYLMFLLAQSPATACDRATALTIRIVRDNTALLTGGRAMTQREREKIKQELREASALCRERNDPRPAQ
jgi:hypothetical protein